MTMSPETSSQSSLSTQTVFISLHVSWHSHQTLRVCSTFTIINMLTRDILLNNLCASIMKRVNSYR